MAGSSKDTYEKNIERSERSWDTVVRYSFVANGTALGLAIGALSKLSGGAPMPQIGKFPIILFFIGLVFSSFHLVFSYALHIWTARAAVERELGEIAAKRDALRDEMQGLHLINPEFSKRSSEIDDMLASVARLNQADPPVDLKRLTSAAELLIFLSYLAFLAGVSVVISRI